jgi:hypothetical protein
METNTILMILAALVVLYLVYRWYSNKNKVTEEQPNNVTFNNHIRPLFTKRDVDSMKWKFDLSDYDDVKENHEAILHVVDSGRMPCYAPWSKDKVRLFRAWIDQGMKH